MGRKRRQEEAEQNEQNQNEYEKSYIKPADPSQQALISSIRNNSLTVVTGPAGSGKTLFSIQTLYQLLKQRLIRKIIIIRLITETCHESLGALPGEKDEKMLPYLMPIIDNLEQFATAGEIEYLINKKYIEAIPVSHCRGRSFNDCGIIVEEAQNLTDEMALTIVTRISEGSKLIFNGDLQQLDIQGRTGLSYLRNLTMGLDDVGIITFQAKNIYRHPLIKAILERRSSLND